MTEPSTPSDPKATVVHVTDDPASYPQIAGYRMQCKLGQGGMATVYMAIQEMLDRPVSIKVMERDALVDEISKQRFENEARTIARLTHPSIVSIYEVGRTVDGRLYYSMPYLPNGDLAQQRFGKDESRISELLRILLSALDYAHARGIVHRDVKQENVLFDGDNRPLLADFGIALAKNDDVRITTAGFAVGSSGYMAPEQARGDSVDGRADIYSVGVLAYELLTGELPFRSTDAFALALMHAQKDIPRLPPAIRHWQHFIDRAMAKFPDARFQNAQQMSSALDKIRSRGGTSISARFSRKFGDPSNESHLMRNGAFVICSALVITAGLYFARGHLPAFMQGATASAKPALLATPTKPRVPTSPAALVGSTTIPAAAALTGATVHENAQNTASATPATVTASAVEVALRDAHSELEHGNLISPPGKNATDLALAAWELGPDTPAAKQLADDVFKAMSTQQALAIAQGNDQRVEQYQQKAQLLDSATIGPSAPAWHAFQSSAAAALHTREQKQAASSDAAGLVRTHALRDQIGQAAPPSTAVIEKQQQQNTTSTSDAVPAHEGVPTPSILASIGTGFVFLHGPEMGRPAAAIARGEVTLHDYKTFVDATHRAASDCTNPIGEGAETAAVPDRRNGTVRSEMTMRRNRRKRLENADMASPKSWNDPGFPQADDYPVVCVSWMDATAYAKWLSARSGRHYRLPSLDEWKRSTIDGTGSSSASKGTVAVSSGTSNALGLTGLDGNVSEWLQDCAYGCARHLVAGRSWRDRGAADNTHGRISERGFNDVGFRIVQVLGSRNQ